MACVLGFQELASRNPFVKDLEELGYDVDFVGGFLVLYGLPYLGADRALKHGDLVSKVRLNADGAIDPPTGDHQTWFRGEQPCAESGESLKMGWAENRLPVAPDFEASHAFSFKLKDENGGLRDYVSIDEKIETYVAIITGPAISAHPKATPLRAIAKKAAAQSTPLRYPDTSSANYGLNDVSDLLRGKKVAIVGLGGTGSYILDLVVRTFLERIALFDADKIHMHTIFRMPGCFGEAIGQGKVEALAQYYSKWRPGIEANRERITEENVAKLGEFDFVFVSVDDGAARRLIVDWLTSHEIPFVDTGMGLNPSAVGLNGVVRITGVDRAVFERTIGTVGLPQLNPLEDEYRKQAQIAELNALNASLAVVRFKQHFGMFDRASESAYYMFETASWTIDTEKTHQ